MRSLSLASLCVAWSGLCAGCFLHDGGGHPSSSALAFDDCSGDCTLDDNPLAAGGARSRIVVKDTAFVAARTSDPAVATVHVDPPRVEVFTGAPGTTTLDILDSRGRVVASGRLTVVPTSRLEVLRGWPGAAPRVVAGTPQIFHVVTKDGQGNSTRGDGAVQFTLGGTLANALIALDGDAIGLVGSPGPGTVTASCPDATVSQEIDIVAASEVVRLDGTGTVEPDGTAVVTMVPATAAGPVYAPPCQWRTSDPSVTLAADVAPALALGPGEVAVFNLNRPGSFTVSCAVAGQTATVTLQR